MKVIVKWPLSHDGKDYPASADPQDVAGLDRDQARHLEGLGAIEVPKAAPPTKDDKKGDKKDEAAPTDNGGGE